MNGQWSENICKQDSRSVVKKRKKGKMPFLLSENVTDLQDSLKNKRTGVMMNTQKAGFRITTGVI